MWSIGDIFLVVFWESKMFSMFQLLVNYGLRINNPKKERQKVLAEKFNLQCKCEACKNSWLEKPALIEVHI